MRNYRKTSIPSQSRQADGFTLVEVLVVLSIFSIMGAIITVGSVKARRTFAVRDASEQLAGHIREAMTLTQSGVRTEGCVDDQDPRCSWYSVKSIVNGRTYSREVLEGGDSLSYELPAGAVFASGSEAVFAYCPPLLYVTDYTTMNGYLNVSDACSKLPADSQLIKYNIVHATDDAIGACVSVETPGSVTVQMDPC